MENVALNDAQREEEQGSSMCEQTCRYYTKEISRNVVTNSTTEEQEEQNSSLSHGKLMSNPFFLLKKLPNGNSDNYQTKTPSIHVTTSRTLSENVNSISISPSHVATKQLSLNLVTSTDTLPSLETTDTLPSHKTSDELSSNDEGTAIPGKVVVRFVNKEWVRQNGSNIFTEGQKLHSTEGKVSTSDYLNEVITSTVLSDVNQTKSKDIVLWFCNDDDPTSCRKQRDDVKCPPPVMVEIELK